MTDAPPDGPTGIAVFDFDGTLTDRDSLLPFLRAWAGHAGRFAPRLWIWPTVATYALGLRSDRSVKQSLLRRFLAGADAREVAEFAAGFVAEWLPRCTRAEGVERLRHHQGRGDRIILLSASPDLYVPAAAAAWGIGEVLCTRVEVVDGRVTGTIIGDNIKGEAKVALLRRHLGPAFDNPGGPTWAYGDSRSDLPVLRWADHGLLWRSGGFAEVGKG